MPKVLKKVKPGEPITAAAWNELVDLIQRAQIILGPDSGLDGMPGPRGFAIKARKDNNGGFLAVADGNITARSGTTLGKGKAKLVAVNVTISGSVITAYTASVTSFSYSVYYGSSHTMTSGNGIDSGMYCWVQPDQSGLLAVAPLDCS
jgi:hypothetical protein